MQMEAPMFAEKRSKKAVRMPAKADLNVTPLIDVLLVLLVIFMVISPINSTGLKTLVPQQAPPGGVQKPEEAIILSLREDGTIRINQELLELSVLMPRLQEIFKTRSDRTIFVQADNALLFNDVATLIDVAKGAGAERVGLLTEQLSAH
jgi:biopolymer transport protein ExbD